MTGFVLSLWTLHFTRPRAAAGSGHMNNPEERKRKRVLGSVTCSLRVAWQRHTYQMQQDLYSYTFFI